MFRKVRNFAQSLLSHGAVTVECWTKVNTQFVKLKPVTRQSIGVPTPHIGMLSIKILLRLLFGLFTKNFKFMESRKGFCASSVEHMLQVSAGRAFLGLDRVCYIPGTGPRPRYEEQVAQNCSALYCCGTVRETRSIVLALDGARRAINRWKLLEATNFLLYEESAAVQQG